MDSAAKIEAQLAATQAQLASLNASANQNANATATTGKTPPPQYPKMPEISEERGQAPDFTIGATGTAFFAGLIADTGEYNEDFVWRDRIEIYDEMLRSDGMITAIREAVEQPIKSAEWSIKPGNDSARAKAAAELVERALFGGMRYTTSTGRILTQTWMSILDHALLYLWDGFMLFEVCYRTDPETGETLWSHWIPLLPRTIWRWWVGPDTELEGVQQRTFLDYTYRYVDIPADKLLRFTCRQEGNNYEGISRLRSAYKHWWMKSQYEKVQAVGIERTAVAFPIVYYPDGASESEIAAAQKFAANMRVNAQMGGALPISWEVKFPPDGQGFTSEVQNAIEYHDQMVARASLANFLNLGTTKHGSYSADKSQGTRFLDALQSVANYIEDVINPAIRRLCDYNLELAEDEYPSLVCSRLVAQDLDAISTALQNMTQGQQPLVHPTPEIEEWLLKQLGVPAPAIEDLQALYAAQQQQQQQAAQAAQAAQAGRPPATMTEAPAPETEQAFQAARRLAETLERVYAHDPVERARDHIAQSARRHEGEVRRR